MQLNKAQLKKYFELTFNEAKDGIKNKHGGPFGAAVIQNGKIISSSHNTVLRDNDPTCHAEVNAIRAACQKLQRPHLDDCILIASSEPCPMCLTTSYWAQVKEIHYAVSKNTADLVGFSDDFIYEELKKTPENASIPVIHHPEEENNGKKVFMEWIKFGKKLY